ncbi:MAG: LmeA family phospholipid-binding protein [Nocardioidaceae bacterium]
MVIAVLLTAGDRLAANFAASEAERRLTARGFIHPTVEIHGFPFLTQLLHRNFTEVAVRARAVEVEGGRAQDLNAVLRDVRVPPSGPVHVGQLAADGTVPYALVTRVAGVRSLHLGPGPAGQVRLTATVAALGQAFSVTALARVQASGTRLRVVPTGVDLQRGGPLDRQLSGLLAQRIALSYPIPSLPKGLRIDQVSAVKAGFLVHVSGRDVDLPRH